MFLNIIEHIQRDSRVNDMEIERIEISPTFKIMLTQELNRSMAWWHVMTPDAKLTYNGIPIVECQEEKSIKIIYK